MQSSAPRLDRANGKDKSGQFLLMNIESDEQQTSTDLTKTKRQLEEKYQTVDEDEEIESEVAWDDVFGAALCPQQVRKAREEEVECVRKMQLYEKVPIKGASNKQARPPSQRGG